jgi:hypothetical protein
VLTPVWDINRAICVIPNFNSCGFAVNFRVLDGFQLLRMSQPGMVLAISSALRMAPGSLLARA